MCLICLNLALKKAAIICHNAKWGIVQVGSISDCKSQTHNRIANAPLRPRQDHRGHDRQKLFVVRKLNANDVAWLRENDPQTLAEKAKQLGEELSLLASAVGPETVSIEDVEAA